MSDNRICNIKEEGRVAGFSPFYFPSLPVDLGELWLEEAREEL